MGDMYNLKRKVAKSDSVNEKINVASANGAITVERSTVMITKGTAAALTLAAPVAGDDDGVEITFISTTAAAHTVTQTSPGFNNGGSAKDVATFGGAIGDGFSIVAYNGVWYTERLTNVTLA